MKPESSSEKSPFENSGRRTFVKKSLMTSLIASQPTLLVGLLRAEGGGGGGNTTWPNSMDETTVSWTDGGTTSPCGYDTTWPVSEYETTTPETLPPSVAGMKCVQPWVGDQVPPDIKFKIGIEEGAEEIRVLASSKTRVRDDPETEPYLKDTPKWEISLEVQQIIKQNDGTLKYQKLTPIEETSFGGEQTRHFEFNCQGDTITSKEVNMPPKTPKPDEQDVKVGQGGKSSVALWNLKTLGGRDFSINMTSWAHPIGEKEITLYLEIRGSYWQEDGEEGQWIQLGPRHNDKNLGYRVKYADH